MSWFMNECNCLLSDLTSYRLELSPIYHIYHLFKGKKLPFWIFLYLLSQQEFEPLNYFQVYINYIYFVDKNGNFQFCPHKFFLKVTLILLSGTVQILQKRALYYLIQQVGILNDLQFYKWTNCFWWESHCVLVFWMVNHRKSQVDLGKMCYF